MTPEQDSLDAVLEASDIASFARDDAPQVLTWPLVERRRSGGDRLIGSPMRRHDDVIPTAARRAQIAQAPPLEPFRWASIAISLLIATSVLTTTSYRLLGAAAALIVYAAIRTLRPIRYDDDRVTTVEIGLEFVFHTVAILATESWNSPYAIVLLPTAVLAAFARGPSFALQLSSLSALVISIRHVWKASETGETVHGIQAAGAWLALFTVVALVTGWARQVLRESARQQSLAMDRVGRLAEANALLYSLHRVAQTLPASLDLDEVLDSTLHRLRDLIEFDATTILLFEESDGTWVPVRHAGNPGQISLTTDDLPAPLKKASLSSNAVTLAPRAETDIRSAGLLGEARSGIYASLHARGALIGLLAIESLGDDQFGAKEIEILNGLVEPFGVAIDNARWFSRLRSIGADEERTRIARDLHDQIGQALAHLGFELDRAMRAADRGDEMRPVLEELRSEVRGVVRMVRETLYDLRTDVSETQDVGTTMALFLDRVAERSGLIVKLDRQDNGRLPIMQERELWRIAKEAVINSERHAHAKELVIKWRCDGRAAELLVRDDGVGFERASGRADSYGIVGMRERATSVGARFEIESEPGHGTSIRITLSPS